MDDFAEFFDFSLGSQSDEVETSPFLAEYLESGVREPSNNNKSAQRLLEDFFSAPFFTNQQDQTQSKTVTDDGTTTKAQEPAQRLRLFDLGAAMLIQDTKVGESKDQTSEPLESTGDAVNQAPVEPKTWCDDLKGLGMPPRDRTNTFYAAALRTGVPVEKRDMDWCNRAVDCFVNNADPANRKEVLNEIFQSTFAVEDKLKAHYLHAFLQLAQIDAAKRMQEANDATDPVALRDAARDFAMFNNLLNEPGDGESVLMNAIKNSPRATASKDNSGGTNAGTVRGNGSSDDTNAGATRGNGGSDSTTGDTTRGNGSGFVRSVTSGRPVSSERKENLPKNLPDAVKDVFAKNPGLWSGAQGDAAAERAKSNEEYRRLAGELLSPTGQSVEQTAKLTQDLENLRAKSFGRYDSTVSELQAWTAASNPREQ